MTNRELIEHAIDVAREAQTLRPESRLLWPDSLAPQRRRAAELREVFAVLCEEIDTRGLAEAMRVAERHAFGE